MPSNSIAFARHYTSVIDEVYQRASVSGVLNSGRRMVRAGHNAKEIDGSGRFVWAFDVVLTVVRSL